MTSQRCVKRSLQRFFMSAKGVGFEPRIGFKERRNK